MSESRFKELANTEAGSGGNHVAGGQRSGIRDRPRQLAGRSGERNAEICCSQKQSVDATWVYAPDFEEEVQAATSVTASRIILSMTATKVDVKEQHYSLNVGWRNMTAKYGKHNTNKCWGKIKNILMGEMVVDVLTTFVSENHGYVVVHRGIGFPSSGSVAASIVIERVRTAHFNTRTTPRIKPMWFDGEMTGKRNSCRGMRWSHQTRVEDQTANMLTT